MKCWIELYDADGILQERLACTDPINGINILAGFVALNSVFDFVTASCWLMIDTKPQEQWMMEIK